MKKFLAIFLSFVFAFLPSLDGQWISLLSASRAPGTSFTPASLTNIDFWQEGNLGAYSDAGSTPSVNNGVVQQWNDQTGNGNNLIKTTANQPVYKTAVLNSLAVLNFTSAVRYTENSVATNGAQQSMGFVIRCSDVSTQQSILSGQSGSQALGLIITSSSKFMFWCEADTFGVASTTAISNNVWHTIIVTYDNSSKAYAYYLDGVADGSGTLGSAFSLLNHSTRIGANSSASSPFQGDIAAVAKGHAIWTPTECANLASYWQAKYAHY